MMEATVCSRRHQFERKLVTDLQLISLLRKLQMSGPYYGCEPSRGLHVLKDNWGQKRFLGPQSKFVTDHLEDAIASTKAAVPKRHQGYQLDRTATEAIDATEQERRLEAAMMKRWNAPDMWAIPRAWDRLVAFQVPLFAEKQKGKWGCIDLLGVNPAGLPVVVELKRSPNVDQNGQTQASESPLRMVLEAASYGIALRVNWTQFREQWIERLKALSVPAAIVDGVPETLETVPLVAAAPAAFWIDWLPVTPKGKTVSQESWQYFDMLLNEMDKHGLPVSFVSICGHDGAAENLAVQPLEHFPPIACQ